MNEVRREEDTVLRLHPTQPVIRNRKRDLRLPQLTLQRIPTVEIFGFEAAEVPPVHDAGAAKVHPLPVEDVLVRRRRLPYPTDDVLLPGVRARADRPHR